MANFKAVMRLYRKLSQRTNECIIDALHQLKFNQININGITLDLGSTLMTRSMRGLHRAKRGHASLHPLTALAVGTRDDD